MVKLRRLVLLAALVAFLPRVAAAQIYTWHDAQGTMVVSNRPRADNGEMRSYAVAGTKALRAARPAQGPSRYDDTIEDQAARHGVSAELVRAVIQAESAFNPLAVSSKGAMGLMQLMPATARALGVSNPFLPEQNIAGGVSYLRQLLDRYDNNVELALAAYNAGPANVEKYGDIPPFAETQRYVRKVTDATGPTSTAPPAPVIYTWVDMVDGRAVPRYSNEPPPSGVYTIVGARSPK